MIFSIARALGYSVQNFFRNFWLSMATILVMVVVLFLINTLVAVDHLKSIAFTAIDQKVDVALFFKPSAAEAEVRRVETELSRNPSVDHIILVSPDEGLQYIKERYPRIAEKVLPTFTANPLGYTLKIKTRELEDYQPLLLSIENNAEYMSLLDATNLSYSRDFATRIDAVSKKINSVALILVALFGILAAIIMFNSIRVSIYAHREEIGIMKLVGATNWFIRMPYLFETILYTVVAVAVSAVLFSALLQFIDPYLDRFFIDVATVDLVGFFKTKSQGLILMQLFWMGLVNVLSTTLALRRYLRA